MSKPKKSEHWMTTWDGTSLFYRAGQLATPQERALILFHGGHGNPGRSILPFALFSGYARQITNLCGKGTGLNPLKVSVLREDAVNALK